MGIVNLNLEVALTELITIAKDQSKEIEKLKEQVKGHCDRIAVQSELLSNKAEAQIAHLVPKPTHAQKPNQTINKKDK